MRQGFCTVVLLIVVETLAYYVLHFFLHCEVTVEEAKSLVKDMLQKEGKFKQKNMVVVITGLMEAGKTTLLYRLFGKEPPKKYTSTGVTEPSWRGLTQYTADMKELKLLENHEDIFELVAKVKISDEKAEEQFKPTDHGKQTAEMDHNNQTEEMDHNQQAEKMDHKKKTENVGHEKQTEEMDHGQQAEKIDHDKQTEEMDHGQQADKKEHGKETVKMDQAKQTGMDDGEHTEETTYQTTAGKDLDSVPQLVEAGAQDGNKSEGEDKDWDEMTGQKVIPQITNIGFAQGEGQSASISMTEFERSVKEAIIETPPLSFIEMVEIIRKNPKERYGELELVHMVDTGGQPECLETMPLLIHNAHLILLVINLSISLDEYTRSFFHKEDIRYDKRSLLACNRELIEQLAQTMAAQTQTKHSKIIIVATHKDKVKEGDLEEKLNTLTRDVFSPRLLYSKGKDQSVFDVNLLDPDEKALPRICKIIAKEMKAIKELNIPPSFVMFEREARFTGRK